jgi:thiol:disulfide interchange protein
MNKRQALVFALAVCGALGLLLTYKLGPRVYNRYRGAQLQGRKVYDVNADTRAQYVASLARAQTEKKQLLVMLGGNWCQWCLALDALMHEDQQLRDYLSEHFVVLKLDSAAAKVLDESWGKPTRHGVPVLIFVAHDGTVRHVQETVSLEVWNGRILAHDPHRVLELLKRWT